MDSLCSGMSWMIVRLRIGIYERLGGMGGMGGGRPGDRQQEVSFIYVDPSPMGYVWIMCF